MSRARVGVDTGGTFTDMVATDPGGGFRVAKTLSTPEAPSEATRDALARAALEERGAVRTLVHGTTIATNALLERTGARVGLIATEGFGDVLLLGRGGRPNSFDLDWVQPRHLVPRMLVREVSERVAADGAVRAPLEEEGARRAIRELAEAGVEAIAVSLLFSFLEDRHERRLRQLIEEEAPDLAVSLASEVFPQMRDYERASTAVIDAYLKPPVDRYALELEELASEREVDELLIMRSNGGAITPDGVRRLPVSMVRSGPAGGVIAAQFVAEAAGLPNVMLADMGGTSFDVCMIAAGQPLLSTEAELEWGLPICQPMVDVRSIGAGGGSIAWVDAAGILNVGPQSAGSRPGPACYGRGGVEPTVTDANLLLGRLSPELALAGDVELDPAAAEAAVSGLAGAMGRSVEEAALGILEIADNNMAQELRLISIDRGIDPREFALMAFGGAGPLHASSLARALGMEHVVVPVFPGAFSAFGALIADTRFDYLKTAVIAGGEDVEAVAGVFAALEARARADLEAQGHAGAEPELEHKIDMRYPGQAWELEVRVGASRDAEAFAAAREQFHRDHLARFGWNLEESVVDCVNFKLSATIPRSRPPLAELDGGPLPEPASRREVVFGGGERVETPVYWRSDLHAGNEVEGPAVIAEAISTTLLAPGDRLRVDPIGNLRIEVP
jgi:N-methylhydantoinase A